MYEIFDGILFCADLDGEAHNKHQREHTYIGVLLEESVVPFEKERSLVCYPLALHYYDTTTLYRDGDIH